MKKYLTATILLICSVSAFATTTEKIPGATVQDAAFFTGKPYDSDLGSYTFNARNYNPEINRWTSADPSGFIDGANNQSYAPTPTIEFDYMGLYSQRFDVNIATREVTADGPQYTKVSFLTTYDRGSFVISDARLEGQVSGSKTFVLWSKTWTVTAPSASEDTSNLGPTVNGKTQWSFTVNVGATQEDIDVWGANATYKGSTMAVGGSATYNTTLSSSAQLTTNWFE